MNKKEMEYFIEEMKMIGDIWTSEEVKRVFGKKSLKQAIKERKEQIGILGDIISTIINR